MAGKKHVYYTFKVLTPDADPVGMDFVVECHKWDEMEGGDDLPVETYKVMPGNKTAVGGCTCPAWKWDCKHVKAVNEAIAGGKIGELHRWKWGETTGWVELTDLDVSTWEL